MAPTARSLILDLLSTLRGGAMPVRALVAAGDLFGIAQNNVQVAATRLRNDGLVERDERGRYRLGRAAQAVGEQIGSWRRVASRLRPWRGEWVGVHGGGPAAGARRVARRPHARALRFLGFRTAAAGFDLRPDNLRGGVAAVRERLRGLGLAPDARVFGVRDLEGMDEARARALWDADGLCAAYDHSRAALAASERRLRGLPQREAMVESFLLGGQVIRQIVFDPLLPEPIVPAGALGRLVGALQRYDALGRGCWAEFMAAQGAPHRRTPADVRVADAAGHLAAAAGGAR